MTTNRLYFGDNLDILRNHIPAESVDLIYLDPPFNSSRSYNVLFKDESGLDSEAQITAFDDTWHWGPTAEETYRALVTEAPARVSTAIDALVTIIGRNQMMAYLVMMSARLVELHRVLKPTGSLYLHCDSTASHYLKIILDTIFGPENFQNEITWKRTSSHNDAKRKYGRVTDTILYYAKSQNYTFNVQYVPHSQEYIDGFYRHVDENGRRYRISDLNSPNPRPNLTYDYKGYKPHQFGWRVSRERMEQLDAEGRLYFPKSQDGRIQLKRYLDEMQGVPMDEVWDDIKPLHAHAAERLGYPTQKPEELLERIIKASSNVGDVVLDPFCGCGTAVAAAQKLGRQWIGIDITHLSISLMKFRLESAFALKPKVDYEVIGEPIDKAGATNLAQQNRHQFEWWALSLVRAKPSGSTGDSKKGKKGADRGIDGVINFFDGKAGSHLTPQRVLVQVKSGKVKSGDIRDLVGTVEREKAAMGVFITLEPPTRDMTKEALSAGVYASPVYGKDFPRIQILTIEDLLAGEQVKMPTHQITFKQAERVKSGPTAQNLTLDLYGEADGDEDEDDT